MNRSIQKRSVKTAIRYLYQHKELSMLNFITNYEISLKILNKRKSLKAGRVEIDKARAVYRSAKWHMLLKCPYKHQSDIPLDDINLSTRVKNTLKREGITTIGHLGNTEFNKLRRMEGIGKSAIRELYHLYDYFGLYKLFSSKERVMNSDLF